MNSDYKIVTIFSEDEVKELLNLIEKRGEWIDGLKSTYGIDHNMKRNVELSPTENVKSLRNIISKRYYENIGVHEFTTPNDMTIPIISKTTMGGYYKTHVDAADSGEYSTTLFFSDPKDYDGGELCLYLNGKIKKVKLKPGKAIIYKTGTIHCVNEVTRGERIVSVFWIKSLISDSRIRDILPKMRYALKLLRQMDEFKDGDTKTYQNIEDSLNDPYFIIRLVKNELISNFSK